MLSSSVATPHQLHLSMVVCESTRHQCIMDTRSFVKGTLARSMTCAVLRAFPDWPRRASLDCVNVARQEGLWLPTFPASAHSSVPPGHSIVASGRSADTTMTTDLSLSNRGKGSRSFIRRVPAPLVVLPTCLSDLQPFALGNGPPKRHYWACLTFE
jgi:hypothetical protein